MCKTDGFYDELAVRNSLDVKTIISSFTIDKVVPAVNIDEYAPAIIPIMMAKTNSLIVEPPNKYSASKVNRVVAVVFIERAIV